ncbi:hypothetical protein EC08BKT55439_1266 [Escherichia coli 08BKT055439]|uniref:Transposase n=2 Tax=Escherichia coli TaxID=562 RepID=A0AAV3HGY7_ECOLX|nr:hypothetical protein ECoA_00427 [Escherichia coli O157:H7 str. 1044]EHU61804.1 hypothetical protein ECDEC3B_1932 [Escherichia coli DEC3B]EHV29004.1 hypothetical protein ECDEC4F_0920 [Escherichia coli DEC4F]EIN32633.1 hypothetical protein ECFDA517_5990 [Escherichia coli FDA517]EIN47816.1 hypothetical protein EC93001_5783 [Escherichia coli 93-001]EIN47991.1 hypothetical protein ECPA3_5807 [Escherichia coli PA3]EIN55513.1 hypothetical protein ECPA9_5818 [Escherichia coli PA9]EIN69483.1 hypot
MHNRFFDHRHITPVTRLMKNGEVQLLNVCRQLLFQKKGQHLQTLTPRAVWQRDLMEGNSA